MSHVMRNTCSREMDFAVVACVLVLAGAGAGAAAGARRAARAPLRPGWRRNMANVEPLYKPSGNASDAIFEDDISRIPKLRYYYSGLEHYTELPLAEAERVLEHAHSWYNASRTTVIFVHGFTGRPDGPAVTTLVQAFLERGDCNVALLNWQALAAVVADTSLPNSYLNWAAPNARKLGVQFADALTRLAAAGVALPRTQLVGHSLGAHVLGVAGNTLRAQGVTLPWITGLDPAGAGFENKPAAARLHAGSAAVVVALHSDPSKYGIKRPVGAVDFWPNFRAGPVRQPGCPDGSHPRFSPEDLCNHNRSWRLLADAARHPGSLLGCLAKNYRAWKNSPRPDRDATTLDLDAYGKHIVPGNYYFTTRAEAPFGLGAGGL